MPSIQSAYTARPAETGPASSLVLLLAAGAGLGVASLYYSQPMLGILETDIHAEGGAVGLVPTLTQLGYAAGLLLLAPLGDRYDRRRIIVAKAVLLALALLASGLAPGLGALLAASLAVGLTATLAQDFVPAAAIVAPDSQRGKTVGKVMTGLLLGILLSRVVSGVVAQHWGWRAMYVSAAVAVGLVGLAAARGLPAFRPTTGLGYGELLGSMLRIWRKHGELRRAALSQGLLAVSFSAFWSTLALMLHGEPFQLGSAVAGSFGLAGAAGALAAPLAGRLSDRGGPEWVTRAGAVLSALAFVLMGVGTLASPRVELILLAVGAVAFDFGVQATLIAHQTIVYGLDHGARSRLNALLFTSVFVGMASGSALGSLAFTHGGWLGVVALAAASAVGALAVRLVR